MKFVNILVPTDGSDYTKAAIDKSFELAHVTGGHITALYVRDKGASDDAGKAATGYVADLGREKHVDVVEQTIVGVPADVIAAESAKYDIIVMGTLGRTGMKKILVGSVAETVVKNAVCPVIVVRNVE